VGFGEGGGGREGRGGWGACGGGGVGVGGVGVVGRGGSERQWKPAAGPLCRQPLAWARAAAWRLTLRSDPLDGDRVRAPRQLCEPSIARASHLVLVPRIGVGRRIPPVDIEVVVVVACEREQRGTAFERSGFGRRGSGCRPRGAPGTPAGAAPMTGAFAPARRAQLASSVVPTSGHRPLLLQRHRLPGHGSQLPHLPRRRPESKHRDGLQQQTAARPACREALPVRLGRGQQHLFAAQHNY
jgi:hypothetical protein